MSNTNIYVGNLPYSVQPDDIKALFAPFGHVIDVAMALDMATGRPRGFCFVRMATEDEAIVAVARLKDAIMGGRLLTINQSRKPFGITSASNTSTATARVRSSPQNPTARKIPLIEHAPTQSGAYEI